MSHTALLNALLQLGNARMSLASLSASFSRPSAAIAADLQSASDHEGEDDRVFGHAAHASGGEHFSNSESTLPPSQQRQHALIAPFFAASSASPLSSISSTRSSFGGGSVSSSVALSSVPARVSANGGGSGGQGADSAINAVLGLDGDDADFRWHFDPSNPPSRAHQSIAADTSTNTAANSLGADVGDGRNHNGNGNGDIGGGDDDGEFRIVSASAGDDLLRAALSVARQRCGAIATQNRALKLQCTEAQETEAALLDSCAAWRWQFQQAQDHVTFLLASASASAATGSGHTATTDASSASSAPTDLPALRGRALDLAAHECQRLEAALLAAEQHGARDRRAAAAQLSLSRASEHAAVAECDRLRAETEQLHVALATLRREGERAHQAADTTAAHAHQAVDDANARADASAAAAAQWRQQHESEVGAHEDTRRMLAAMQTEHAALVSRSTALSAELTQARLRESALATELESARADLDDTRRATHAGATAASHSGMKGAVCVRVGDERES